MRENDEKEEEKDEEKEEEEERREEEANLACTCVNPISDPDQHMQRTKDEYKQPTPFCKH